MAVGDADHLPAFRLFQLLPPLAQKMVFVFAGDINTA